MALTAGAARHVQVLRLQPGAAITLFGGLQIGNAEATAPPPATGEFDATVLEMGRSEVRVVVGAHRMVDREPARALHLAIGMPANERMDWLVEKATELGVASVQALMTERSVVRLEAERARKKCEHWRSIAIASCEQCGRNRVPAIPAVASLRAWLALQGNIHTDANPRLLLSLRPGAIELRQAVQGVLRDAPAVTILAGPEGGLGPAEEDLALSAGFQPVTLGPRVLRSETAALVALTLLA